MSRPRHSFLEWVCIRPHLREGIAIPQVKRGHEADLWELGLNQMVQVQSPPCNHDAPPNVRPKAKSNRAGLDRQVLGPLLCLPTRGDLLLHISPCPM